MGVHHSTYTLHKTCLWCWHTHTHTLSLFLSLCDTCNNGSKQQFIVVFYTQPMKEPVHLLRPLCGTEWYLNNRKHSHKKTRLEAMHQRTQGQNTVLFLYIHIETNWEDGMKMWILNSMSMQNWPVFRHNVNNINMRHTNTKLDKADTCWEQYQHRHIGSPNLH